LYGVPGLSMTSVRNRRLRTTIAHATPLAFPRLWRDDTRVRVQTWQEMMQ